MIQYWLTLVDQRVSVYSVIIILQAIVQRSYFVEVRESSSMCYLFHLLLQLIYHKLGPIQAQQQNSNISSLLLPHTQQAIG